MKDCKPAGDCHYNKFRRPLYFHGMLLDDKSFTDEQEYHVQKRRLLNRMLYGSGVVCGLQFGFDDNDPKSFTIECGLALDCAGREIYVPCQVRVKIPSPEKNSKDPCAPKGERKEICYRIRIAYTESDTDVEQVRLPGAGCEDKTCKPTRKREGFCITLDECSCPTDSKPADCADLITRLQQPIECTCGCGCGCGDVNAVSIGTVHVSVEGKMTMAPTYECRDYVFSGQMLKQILTGAAASSDPCACPDQLERLKDLLTILCRAGTQGADLEKQVAKESKDRSKEMDALSSRLDKRLKVVEGFEERIKKLEKPVTQ